MSDNRERLIDTPMWDQVDALFARYEGLPVGEKKRRVGLAVPYGRMGAPEPIHKGLPPVHLEKLSCTACHSGQFPVGAPQPVAPLDGGARSRRTRRHQRS